MLNHEGWCLLLILSALIALMLLALPHMRTERAMQTRLTSHGGALCTAIGTVLCACGTMVLAVIPAAVYRGGVTRLGLSVFAAAGIAVLLCLLVPRIKVRCTYELTLCEAASHDAWTRAGLGAVCALAALLSASAAVAMVARMFAYVFSLHYMIALSAAVALALVLTLLCGARARRAMDPMQVLLLTILLIGTPAAALLLSDNAAQALQSSVLLAAQEPDLAVTLLTDLCAGIGALGLMLPAQHLFSVQKLIALRKGGIISTAAAAVFMLLAAFAGLASHAVGVQAESIPAAETVLTQIAELAALPNPLSALLNAALLTTLLFYAQAALHFAGNTVSWDVVQPLVRQDKDRVLSFAADAAAMAVCALTFPLCMNAANMPLTWYVRDALLLSSVAGGFLLLRAFDAKTSKLGQRIGLAAGAAVVLIVWLVPLPEKYKLLGAIPAVLAAVLLQLFVKDPIPKDEKSA